jgi:hypothetical protein
MSEPNADDLSYTDFPVCPYCADVDVDAWELDIDGDDSIETDCGACGHTYIVARQVSVTYSTRKPK